MVWEVSLGAVAIDWFTSRCGSGVELLRAMLNVQSGRHKSGKVSQDDELPRQVVLW